MRFTVISEENLSKTSKLLADELSVEASDINELLFGFDFDSDAEFAVCAECGCVLVRVFDFGRYSFLYPFEFSEGADAEAAVFAIAEYAMREEIPLVFFDVPKEEVSKILSLGFRHINLDTENEECESFRTEIKSECELLDAVPEVTDGEISLGEICERDIEEYAEISRDESALKFWGYDYREDAPSADDEYFFNTARRNPLAGVSLSLAVRLDAEMIGEVEIYAFDRRGGAEFAVRLLPEFRGRGIGKKVLPLVFEMAENIGLLRLRCDVMNENKPSLAFVGREMELLCVQEGISKYEIKLN